MWRDDFGIGNAEPHLLGALIEAGLGDHLAEHLPVEAERAGLFRRQRMAELAADLLQPVLIGLPELVDAGFRSSRSWQASSWPKPLKMSLMPQTAKLPASKRHDHAHDDAAEPIFGGFTDTSKHVSNAELMPVRPRPAKAAHYKERALRRN